MEKFNGEGSGPENLEDQKYRELQEAMKEEDRIMKEIKGVFTSASTKAEAEKIVLENWGPLLDEAIKKTGKALKEWFDAMNKARE